MLSLSFVSPLESFLQVTTPHHFHVTYQNLKTSLLEVSHINSLQIQFQKTQIKKPLNKDNSTPQGLGLIMILHKKSRF